MTQRAKRHVNGPGERCLPHESEMVQNRRQDYRTDSCSADTDSDRSKQGVDLFEGAASLRLVIDNRRHHYFFSTFEMISEMC
jgi:hypothetical protein